MQTSPVNPAMCRVPQRAGAGAHCETAAGLSAADLDGYLAVPLMGALQARSRGTDVARSLLVTERRIEFVTRQRQDYVRISATVEAAHVAEAAVIMWAVLQQAIGEAAMGWDTAAASAEIRPARPADRQR